ncbi:hypothetical protein OROHE_009515 [Orobanche hederae]
MDFDSNPKPTNEEMVNAYVKTLASVLGRSKENDILCVHIGALISEELSNKVKDDIRFVSLLSMMYFVLPFTDLPGVLWVLPDSYLDVPNKDYGGVIALSMANYFVGKSTSSMRDNTRSRPRPQHDTRRETMHVRKQDPVEGETSTSGQPSSLDKNEDQGVGGGNASA